MMILVDQYIKLIVPEHNSGLLAPPLGPVLGRASIVEGYDRVSARSFLNAIGRVAVQESPDTVFGQLQSGPNGLALLHLDGTNGSTTFTDVYGNTWTGVNGAALSTTNFKFGTASLLSTTNQRITTPDATQWDFVGDFTIECFVYFNTITSMAINTSFLGQTGTVGGASWLLLQCDINNLIHFYASNSVGAYQFAAIGPTVPTGQWLHCALVRSSGIMIAFFQGTSFGSGTLTGTISTNGHPIAIGGDIAAIGEIFDGNIDEVRFSNVARYTSNFTPPAYPFAF
jgi:hypothetical protein